MLVLSFCYPIPTKNGNLKIFKEIPMNVQIFKYAEMY